ncbi:MAG: hypothetical protein WCT18_03315 [Patescibacteria group bacterium]
MEQFLVPQFIDVEDKIIGPITTRQFVLMLIAIFVCFIEFKIFSFAYFLFFAILTLCFFSLFAFARVNGRPIHFFVLSFVQTLKRPRLRVWNRISFVVAGDLVESEIKKIVTAPSVRPYVSGSRLRDLTLIVNTGGIYEADGVEQKIN